MLKTLVHTALVAATLAASLAGFGAAPAAAAPMRAGIVIGDAQETRLAQRAERRGVCSPRQALRKADRLGLNRVRVVREDRRAVVVSGLKRGRLVSVRFAQARGCPVVGVR